MQHPVTVGTDQRQVSEGRAGVEAELGQRGSVMAFDVTESPGSVPLRKVKAANLARKASGLVQGQQLSLPDQTVAALHQFMKPEDNSSITRFKGLLRIVFDGGQRDTHRVVPGNLPQTLGLEGESLLITGKPLEGASVQFADRSKALIAVVGIDRPEVAQFQPYLRGGAKLCRTQAYRESW